MNQKLEQTFATLSEQDQMTVLAFAEFLQQRAPKPDKPTEIETPEPHTRPPEESVVKAIKRLSGIYPMVDRGNMLNETSTLMTEHMINGRSASDVIDDLEALFADHYQRYVDKINEKNKSLGLAV